MERLSEADIHRVLDLDETATAGPWRAKDRTSTGAVQSPLGTTKTFDDGTRKSVCSTWGDDGRHMADAELIAHYRTAAPVMARELLALRRERDALARVAEQLAAFLPWLEAGIWQGHEDNLLDALEQAGYTEERCNEIFRQHYPMDDDALVAAAAEQQDDAALGGGGE